MAGQSYNPIMVARNALRRAFSRSPIVQAKMAEHKRKVPRYNNDGSRAKVDSVEHLCDKCGEWKKSSKGLKVVVDHIDPVVDPEIGFENLDIYFHRLWCDASNLQKICGECHRIKTNAEWVVRRLKTDSETLTVLEQSNDKKLIKKVLKRFKKKLHLYPAEFQERVKVLLEV